MKVLVDALDGVAATRSKKAKVAALAGALKALDRRELPFAARLVLGALQRPSDTRTLGVGWALAFDAAVLGGELDGARLGSETRRRGDFGDAVAALWPARPPGLTLTEVEAAVEEVARAAERGAKLEVLVQLLRRASAGEARYLGKALLGELRIGLQRGLFEEAVAAAFGVPLDQLRRAAALTADPGDLAALAATGELATAAVVPGQVVGFMLASPAEVVKEPVDPLWTVMEDKLDGVRTQAHLAGGRVRLFARGQDDVTEAFPEVAGALRALPRDVIIDGELLAVAPDGRARPFQALQARLNRVEVTRALLAAVPVALVAFDCLYDGEPVVDLMWAERRRRLEALGLRVNPVTAMDPSEPVEVQVERAFAAARARGHEGVMLKRTDSRYEAGRRGSAWRKVKKAFATLDVVITRAEWGHGKRAGVLSDYTFAVWKGDQLVEVGKAYSGLTDVEIAALTTQLEALTVSRHGQLHVVRPHVVLEVAFDGLQRSRRHASGFALRFPRIVRIRADKGPSGADRLEAVTALWAAQVGSGHREEDPQLALFDG